MIRHIPIPLTCSTWICFAAKGIGVKGTRVCNILHMAGMVLDFSDGFAARLLRAYSNIGKDLDSLADVVTFGVAPGAIVFNLLAAAGMTALPAFVIAALIPAASALRLAKFNNDPGQSATFRGMATPASAFTVISVVLASSYTDSRLPDLMTGSPWFMGLLSLFLAVMMLVNVPMFSLKFSSMGWKGNEERYIFAALSLLLLIIFRIAALPMIIAAYILISLLFPFAAGRRTAS